MRGKTEERPPFPLPPPTQEWRGSRRRFLGLCGLALPVLAAAPQLPASSPRPTLAPSSDTVPLRAIASACGLTSKWVEKDRRIELSGARGRLVLELNKREVVFNRGALFLGFPVSSERGLLHVSRNDWESTFRPLLTPEQFQPVPRLARIVLDPGHGGKDPGARNLSLGLEEKALNLDLARRLRPLLTARGYEVHLVREDDRFIELAERAAIGNRLAADLFLSIHFNAAQSEQVRGVETYSFTPRDQPSTGRDSLQTADRVEYPANAHNPWNLTAAYALQRAMRAGLGTVDRGLRRARFVVLRDLTRPGVLVECGFISHPEEAALISTPAHRDRIARALHDGIVAYGGMLSPLRRGA